MKREIGRTSIEIYPIGLGAMPVTSDDEEQKATAVIHAALDAGMNFIDTVDVNTQGWKSISRNEQLIQKAIESHPNHDSATFVAIATKAGLIRPGSAGQTDRPESLRKACEQSLRNLKMEAIFLYQLHVNENKQTFADDLREVAKMKAEGMIRHVGLFNANADQLNQAQKIVRIESIQNRLNPFQQGDLRKGLVQICQQQQVSYLAYSPMGGTYGHNALQSDKIFAELAEKYEVSPYALCLVWLLSKGENIVPIPGATKIENVKENFIAPQLLIEAADLARIDQVKQS